MLRNVVLGAAVATFASSAYGLGAYLPLGLIDHAGSDNALVDLGTTVGGKPIVIKPISYGAHPNAGDDPDYAGINSAISTGPGLSALGVLNPTANPRSQGNRAAYSGVNAVSSADATAQGDYLQFGFEVDSSGGNAPVRFNPESLRVDLDGEWLANQIFRFEVSVNGAPFEPLGLNGYAMAGSIDELELAHPDAALQNVESIEYRMYTWNISPDSTKIPGNRLSARDLELGDRVLFSMAHTYDQTNIPSSVASFQGRDIAIVLGGTIVIPEPGSVAILGLGSTLIAARRRRA